MGRALGGYTRYILSSVGIVDMLHIQARIYLVYAHKRNADMPPVQIIVRDMWDNSRWPTTTSLKGEVRARASDTDGHRI